MKRYFIDTIIDMKINECEEIIKEIHEKVEEIGRREVYVRKDTDSYKGLEKEFMDLIYYRARIEHAKNKLLIIYTKREMNAFFEEYSTFEDFMTKGVESVTELKKEES